MDYLIGIFLVAFWLQYGRISGCHIVLDLDGRDSIVSYLNMC